ncbi:MAG: hypothetical protein A3F53_02590 [Candidatus Zambryskibacteria bacterium RIFCSPHIGHO2_12_FULL_48_10]|uniref:Uncharacterized protein n=1 Tax=Candidatus Zambryskibacteria bacterium RIFCSPHIGHO2_01_FULL_46_25 TaxID=1802738 RepID=A0A1G2T1H6_9BACT|nr:MAG: hypothetical protein UX71_C0002G0017 [Parcubacteria group bacterium GW2011_GWA1_47_10]OHA90689.1 MAG: hypothetical protein A2838_03190 [Candidatus Zambryskibacteria bacterium RIFCSPHIGHO2_01_FULL_46_25]OHB02758.1 MAG: hypothetical protein A3F53_02590 [Candidatus Zambryskibacteria bacterium RIFCSPHIGHO2_12_FULL_48_10]OHB07332.1 MAG: hypothetical protein A3A31_02330 [Candidatus Zambryskibacteria bacterium RIFCSPLOWO2_01_FULL_48_25]
MVLLFGQFFCLLFILGCFLARIPEDKNQFGQWVAGVEFFGTLAVLWFIFLLVAAYNRGFEAGQKVR